MAVPERKLLCGGNGDGGDDYFDTGKFDQLLEIKIRHGGAIDAIILKYMVHGQVLTRHFGGRGGTEDTITLEDGEFLTKITGTYSPAGDSAVIRSLTFYSNNNNIFGPYGGPHVGTAFALPAVKGSIVGFFGYAGTFLDAIGVHT